MTIIRNSISPRAALPLALAAILASPAFAQEPPAEDANKKTAAAEATATDLDTIIVTVERREQDLQKYAGTAQALYADDLRELGINNELRNIQVMVPGLSIANQEGHAEIYMRGVGSANSTELGDPANAPHVNGTYIPRPRGLGAMFYDLERVEVNKGPQGTLRGRNALGGTLNIVTKRPDLEEFGGYVQVEAGNRDHEAGEFAVNLPLGGVAGLRFAGYSVDKGSSFENAGAARHLKPAGIQDEKGGRLSLLYQPDDKLSVFLMADMGKEGGTGYPGANIFRAVTEGNTLPDDLDMRQVIYRGPQGKLDATNWGAMAQISYDFGPVKVEYNGSYRDVDFQQTNASSDSILWPGRNIAPRTADNPDGIEYDNYSSVYWLTQSQSQVHELRFSSPDDARLYWTAGAFHFEENQKSGFFSLNDRGVFYSGTEFTMPVVRSKSTALFADGTFNVNDRFRLKAGLRHTEEEKFRYGIGGNWTIGLGADNNCCFATRLGTEGFMPAFLYRPNFDVSNLTSNADLARFLLQGVARSGARDTILDQLGGIADGSMPNGLCVDRPDTGGDSLNCTADGSHPWVNLGIPQQQIGRSKFDFTDWRLGFEYDASDDSLLYATVSTGHKAGGFNDSFDIDFIPETFKPESLVSFEIGSKNTFRWFNGLRSTFNVSAFYYDYSDQVFQDLAVVGVNQDGDATGFSLVNRNIGKSEIYGLELDSLLRFRHGFSLGLNALYLHTEIKDGVVADVRSQNFGAGGITSKIDLAGNELPLSSEFTFNVHLKQSFELVHGSFDWQFLASYRSAYYLTQFNDRDVVYLSDTAGTVDRIEDAATAGFPDRQRAETTLNAGLGFTSLSGAWRFELWGSNLLNNDVSQKALVGPNLNLRFLNDPRSYGLRVRYNF
ncbi:TonB-dependent receptor [Pseudoxanthomonas sacheonensis]|uniref:Iron complex outermembrane receptor protein n=1 Tax=Pseudoxanthomonas sacheonensis TaxID=443615 RepID=A0ABU1RXX9_9GAMM|nr:TonB-dependent receptor [Pseudoxanthomonas sacheonensis]MDR6843210.1 iron complex outermembrane receptor protein [Pseudoxanthomonas sacheonensis]